MITDKEFELIEKIATEHCNKKFGYLTKDDLKGEIWAICLIALEEFDPVKGKKENFLRRAVKTRLINRFKEITKSVKIPCVRCEFYDKRNEPDCKMFGFNKHSCDKWNNYLLSVESRNSLLNASESTVEREISDESLNKVISDELKETIVKNIQKNFKGDFDRFVSGGKLSKQRIKKLKQEILRIFHEKEELVQVNIRGKNATS